MRVPIRVVRQATLDRLREAELKHAALLERHILLKNARVQERYYAEASTMGMGKSEDPGDHSDQRRPRAAR